VCVYFCLRGGGYQTHTRYHQNNDDNYNNKIDVDIDVNIANVRDSHIDNDSDIGWSSAAA